MAFWSKSRSYSTRLTRISKLTTRISPLKMNERLDELQLTKIHEVFVQHQNKLKMDELKNTLYHVASVTFDDEEFNTFFKMINKTGLGYTTWDEFISFMLVLYEQKNISLEHSSLLQPMSTISKLIKSNHRHPICRITYLPILMPDRTMDVTSGSIITCSKDGTINFWSLCMQLQRTAQSTCPALKVHNTWITDVVVLTDLNVLCTSATERDLRFYDILAGKFDLRIMFTSLQHAVSTMYYRFSKNINQESKLIVGDMAGNIMVIYIVPIQRGPFKSKPGDPFKSCRFERVLKGLVKGFRVVVYKNCHTDFVRQISYYSPLHGFVSCAHCSKAAMRINFFNVQELNEKHIYRVNTGIWCFAAEESAHIIATGGADCLIRIWNPFVPSKPVTVFYGHHKEVVQLTFQDKGKTLYSLDTNRWIKAWNVAEQHCIQTYTELSTAVEEQSSLTAFYNEAYRSWIIGSAKIAVVPLSPIQNENMTDGNTHPNKITVILYNSLFKLIVTCCTDSYILVWNPWDGRRMLLVKNAHTKEEFGEVVPLPITAGAVDPSCLRILTAAVNGTVKIWNILTGTNLRNIQVPSCNEITCVVWVHERIFVSGWNKCIAEFPDTTTKTLPENAEIAKNWELLHDDDISASAVQVKDAVVTASYAGELVFWRLETGQAYKKYNVYNPIENIKIQFQRQKRQRQFHDTESLKAMIKKRKGKDRSYNVSSVSASLFRKMQLDKERDIPKKSIFRFKPISVTCMIFLQTRGSHPDVGSLLVGLSSGLVQVWSHASAGGFLEAFDVAHRIGDYAVCITTDKDNEYLMVGTYKGYIKVYLMKNFGIPNPEKVCMPKYRLKFPFMWGDRIRTGAMIQAAKQPKPTLLSSIKGHTLAVTCIQYINEAEIIISGSVDCSARLWTLSGRYLQTLGTFKKWKPLQNKPVDDDFEFRIPADLQRISSSTTLRVLSGGVVQKKLTFRQMEKSAKKRHLFVDKTKLFGTSVSEPFLGNYYKELKRENVQEPFEFDLLFPHIPVYKHLIVPEVFPIAAVTDYAFNKIDEELEIDNYVNNMKLSLIFRKL